MADSRLKNSKSPHPVPLPNGERGRVRGIIGYCNLGFEVWFYQIQE